MQSVTSYTNHQKLCGFSRGEMLSGFASCENVLIHSGSACANQSRCGLLKGDVDTSFRYSVFTFHTKSSHVACCDTATMITPHIM